MDVSTNMLLLVAIILELVCTARGNDDFYKREYPFYSLEMFHLRKFVGNNFQRQPKVHLFVLQLNPPPNHVLILPKQNVIIIKGELGRRSNLSEKSILLNVVACWHACEKQSHFGHLGVTNVKAS